jgi:hypothetical protein
MLSTLIPQIQLSDFHKVQELGKLKELKSCEVYIGDDYYFTFVNGSVDTSGYLRIQTENKAASTNNVCGKSLEEILGVKDGVT